jgi:hypothetical protein
MRMALAVVSALIATSAALTGCSFIFGVRNTPTVSRESLQKDITDKLTKSGAPPKSVTCSEDLVGEVGKISRCDVDLGPTDSIQAVVKVNSVNGSTVNLDYTPAVSQQQLEKSVSALIADATSGNVDSVSCESGLDGTVGADAFCTVDSAGTTLRREVEVSKAEDLSMNYGVLPILPKDEVGSSLIDELAQQMGQRPDAANCSDNLQGKTGAEVDCVVSAGGQTETFAVTVTGVDGSHINYSYQAKS